MSFLKGFRKKQERKQGLKILVYGDSNVGKSVFALSFPKLAIVDTEAKLGVYENHPKYGANILAIAETLDYYKVLDLTKQVIKSKDEISTLVIDSETKLIDAMSVAAMEVEERRAREKQKDVDDTVISMRGYGKIKLNNTRFSNLRAATSAAGVTFISIAQEKDVYEKHGDQNIKVGVEPNTKKKPNYDYDVVLYLFKQTVQGVERYYARVEKDATNIYKVNEVIENPSYESFKEFFNDVSQKPVLEVDYDQQLEETMRKMTSESVNFDSVKSKVTELLKKFQHDDSLTQAVSLIKEKYKLKELIKDSSKVEKLLEVLSELEGLEKAE